MDADIFGRFASEGKTTMMLSGGVLLPSEEDGTMRLAHGKACCLALPGGGGGFFGTWQPKAKEISKALCYCACPETSIAQMHGAIF